MSRRKSKHASKKLGKPPGFLVYTGENNAAKIQVDVIEADENYYQEKKDVDLTSHMFGDRLNWINVNGISNVEEISEIGEQFGIHPLTLEDVVNVGSRPKFEEFDNYIFIVLKMLYYKGNVLVVEHVSFVLKENMVFTFQEIKEDVFQSIRQRLKEGKGRIRKAGIDYILYALIDALVDHYFVVFEEFSDKIEDLEDEIMLNGEDKVSLKIQQLKREVYKIRKAVFPMREVLNRFERNEHTLMHAETRPFVRDIHDHSIQLIETVENYRDLTMGLMDLHMSNVSNRMNNVMKVLTIIATIFIPLTFIAGIYGMNFEYMPELSYKYSYFILWGVMAVVLAGMIFYFKKKKWL